jgi:hypothetical protein
MGAGFYGVALDFDDCLFFNGFCSLVGSSLGHGLNFEHMEIVHILSHSLIPPGQQYLGPLVPP